MHYRQVGPLIVAVCYTATAFGDEAASLGKPAASEPAGLIIGAFNTTSTARSIEAVELPSRRVKVLRAANMESGRPLLSHPSMSPDGTRLVFNYELEYSNWHELRMIKRDGTRERRILRGGEDALWSPDGSLLLVGGNEVGYIVDPDANRFWTWTSCDLAHARFLSWTADGSGAWTWNMNSRELRRCHFDGTVTTVGSTALDPMDNFVMSPDEKSLLYTSTGSKSIAGPRESYNYGRLVVRDVTGDSARDVFRASDLEDHGNIFWSPDSKWIGGVAQLTDANVPRTPPEIIVKSLETGVVWRLGTAPSPLGLQWWAPTAPATVDTRAIVRAALGKGSRFAPPLLIPGRKERAE